MKGKHKVPPRSTAFTIKYYFGPPTLFNFFFFILPVARVTGTADLSVLTVTPFSRVLLSRKCANDLRRRP